jgi:hypothetical protein
MKQLSNILLLALAVTLPSCKKYIEQQEKNAVLKIMTTGVWYVQSYIQNDSDITATFTGYVFKFDANGTVTGITTGSSTPGTWSANISALTITSNFPSSPDPLKELDETWKITDSGDTYVVANSSDTVSHTTNELRLQKQ